MKKDQAIASRIKKTLAQIRQIWEDLEPVIQKCVASDLIPATVVQAYSDIELGKSKKLSQAAMLSILLRVRRALQELRGVRNAEIAVFGNEGESPGPFVASYLGLRSIVPSGLDAATAMAIEKMGLAVATESSDVVHPFPQDGKVSDMIGEYLKRIIHPFLGTLAQNAPHLDTVLNNISEKSGAEGNIDLTNLAETVAVELQNKSEVFFNVKVNPFPPSVDFGEGDRTVRVSPTVGGTDNPDASINVGLQVDFNPGGEGRRPIGRLTAGVDVDETGKARGASFGWRCRF